MRWPWFRMYSEARTDRKLDLLSDAEFRVWFNLLCMASESDNERGTVDYEDEMELAIETAKGDVELLRHTMSHLVTLKMIDVTPQRVTFPNFEKRQQRKPADTPERTRERKRRSRAKNQNASHPVTPMSHPVTRVTPVEERREEEKKKEIPSVSQKKSAQMLIPENWVPSPADINYAVNGGMTEAQTKRTARRFKNHYIAKGEERANWDAQFRVWIERDLETLHAANGRHDPTNYPENY